MQAFAGLASVEAVRVVPAVASVDLGPGCTAPAAELQVVQAAWAVRALAVLPAAGPVMEPVLMAAGLVVKQAVAPAWRCQAARAGLPDYLDLFLACFFLFKVLAINIPNPATDTSRICQSTTSYPASTKALN